MTLPADATNQEIVDALTRLLRTGDGRLFLPALKELVISDSDTTDIIANKIKEWCATRPDIERSIENRIFLCGIGGLDGTPDEKTRREFLAEYKENRTRIIPPTPTPTPTPSSEDDTDM